MVSGRWRYEMEVWKQGSPLLLGSVDLARSPVRSSAGVCWFLLGVFPGHFIGPGLCMCFSVTVFWGLLSISQPYATHGCCSIYR